MNDIEYLCVRVGGLSPTPRTRYLNDLAEEGWRLVCATVSHEELLYLKRYRHDDVEADDRQEDGL